MNAADHWDAYLVAIQARDAASHRAVAEVEREYRAAIEMRRAAWVAALEREKAQ